MTICTIDLPLFVSASAGKSFNISKRTRTLAAVSAFAIKKLNKETSTDLLGWTFHVGIALTLTLILVTGITVKDLVRKALFSFVGRFVTPIRTPLPCRKLVETVPTLSLNQRKTRIADTSACVIVKYHVWQGLAFSWFITLRERKKRKKEKRKKGKVRLIVMVLFKLMLVAGKGQ